MAIESKEDYTDYQIDIVMCMDVTGSMQENINEAIRGAAEFNLHLQKALNAERKKASDVRVRVIPFRDLGEEGTEAIQLSPWFNIAEQKREYESFLSGLEAKGGGTAPESSLEALWQAMNVSWRETGKNRRSIIVMFTDATAHDLGTFPFIVEQSAFATPKNLDELRVRWGAPGREAESVMKNNFSGRRLVLFAPDMHPWGDIADDWQQTAFLPCPGGKGLSDLDWSAVCAVLAQSV